MEIIGYVASVLVLTTFWMKTMIPLRTVAIGSNIAFLTYGVAGGLIPVAWLHAVLLPLNVYRLWEMRGLVRATRRAAESEFNVEWLVPYATSVSLEAGASLFNAGDEADVMYCLVEGRVRLKELAVDIEPGGLIGEIGLFAPGRKRTATAICVTDCRFLKLPHETVRQLYFQNPAFGFYLVRLITERLVTNLHEVAERRSDPDASSGAGS